MVGKQRCSLSFSLSLSLSLSLVSLTSVALSPVRMDSLVQGASSSVCVRTVVPVILLLETVHAQMDG